MLWEKSFYSQCLKCLDFFSPFTFHIPRKGMRGGGVWIQAKVGASTFQLWPEPLQYHNLTGYFLPLSQEIAMFLAALERGLGMAIRCWGKWLIIWRSHSLFFRSHLRWGKVTLFTMEGAAEANLQNPYPRLRTPGLESVCVCAWSHIWVQLNARQYDLPVGQYRPDSM